VRRLGEFGYCTVLALFLVKYDSIRLTACFLRVVLSLAAFRMAGRFVCV
jgi:hypothetical protein